MSSNFKDLVKNIAFKIVSNKSLNPILRTIYKNLPIKNKKRFPFVGKLEHKFGNNLSINMYSDGADIIVSSLFWDKKYEHSMSELWLKLLEKDYFVLDIGANNGYYSLISGKIATQGKTFAFEPVPRIQSFLYENIRINNLNEIVFVNKDIVSDHIGYTDFYIVDSITLPCGSSENKEFRHGKVPTKIIKLGVNKIDNFLKTNEIPRIDLVKIDTESTENLVIKGMIASIEKFNPIIICEVLSNELGVELKNLLDPLGYVFYDICENGLKLEKDINFNPDAHNHLFIHKNKIDKLKGSNLI